MPLRCRLGRHKWEQIGRRGPLQAYTPVERCARCGCGRYLTLAGAAGAWFTTIPADQMPKTVPAREGGDAVRDRHNWRECGRCHNSGLQKTRQGVTVRMGRGRRMSDRCTWCEGMEGVWYHREGSHACGECIAKGLAALPRAKVAGEERCAVGPEQADGRYLGYRRAGDPAWWYLSHAKNDPDLIAFERQDGTRTMVLREMQYSNKEPATIPAAVIFRRRQ